MSDWDALHQVDRRQIAAMAVLLVVLGIHHAWVAGQALHAGVIHVRWPLWQKRALARETMPLRFWFFFAFYTFSGAGAISAGIALALWLAGVFK